MDNIVSRFAQINDRRKDHFSIDEDFIVKNIDGISQANPMGYLVEFKNHFLVYTNRRWVSLKDCLV